MSTLQEAKLFGFAGYVPAVPWRSATTYKRQCMNRIGVGFMLWRSG